MEDIDGQVLGVQGTATRNGNVKYDVAFSNGQKYTTFEQATAQKCQALQGQLVTMRVETTIKGQYTNHNVRDIAPQGQLPPLAMPVAGGTPVQSFSISTAGPPSPTPVAIPMAAPPIPDAERQHLIVWQSSMSTAFGFIGRLFHGAGPEAHQEAVDLARDLAEKIHDKVFGVSAPAVPATPAAVADQVNAAVAGAVQVGTAPTPSW